MAELRPQISAGESLHLEGAEQKVIVHLEGFQRSLAFPVRSLLAELAEER